MARPGSSINYISLSKLVHGHASAITTASSTLPDPLMNPSTFPLGATNASHAPCYLKAATLRVRHTLQPPGFPKGSPARLTPLETRRSLRSVPLPTPPYRHSSGTGSCRAVLMSDGCIPIAKRTSPRKAMICRRTMRNQRCFLDCPPQLVSPSVFLLLPYCCHSPRWHPVRAAFYLQKGG
jgi:hypothetical protein